MRQGNPPTYDFTPSVIPHDEYDHGVNNYPLQNLCKTEQGYYFVPVGGEQIYFCDKATDFSGPLCSRLECTHSDDTCQSYAPHCIGLSYYEGNLIWLARDGESYQILTMSPDGTNRKTVVDDIEVYTGGNGGNCKVYFHKGYAYLAISENAVENAKPLTDIRIAKICLKSGERYELYSHRVETDSLTLGLLPVGDELYYYHQFGDQNSGETLIQRWAASDEPEVLYFEASLPIGIKDMSANEGKLYFSHGSGKVSLLDNGEIRLVHDFNEKEPIYEDVYFDSDKIVASSVANIAIPETSLIVTDYSFSTLFEGSYQVPSDDGLLGLISFFGGISSDGVIYRNEYTYKIDGLTEYRLGNVFYHFGEGEPRIISEIIK